MLTCWRLVVAFVAIAWASASSAEILTGRVVRIKDGDTVEIVDRAKRSGLEALTTQPRTRLAGIMIEAWWKRSTRTYSLHQTPA
jgi:hypothetical protein